jgi:hypothetical protein
MVNLDFHVVKDIFHNFAINGDFYEGINQGKKFKAHKYTIDKDDKRKKADEKNIDPTLPIHHNFASKPRFTTV